MPRLTELESSLLAQLRVDGRAPVSVLAQRLKVSRTTVTRLMTKLEAAGVILGYTVRTHEDKDPGIIRALSNLEVERHSSRKVSMRLGGIPEIQTIYTTNGEWDLILELSCANLADFDRVLGKIRSVPGVVNSQTNLLLTTVNR